MIVLNVLGTLFGLLFVLGGGCTVIYWGFALLEGGYMSDPTLTVPLIVVGGLVTWAGVAIIRAIWRRRTNVPSGSQL
jgi:hypothetical protein